MNPKSLLIPPVERQVVIDALKDMLTPLGVGTEFQVDEAADGFTLTVGQWSITEYLVHTRAYWDVTMWVDHSKGSLDPPDVIDHAVGTFNTLDEAVYGLIRAAYREEADRALMSLWVRRAE